MERPLCTEKVIEVIVRHPIGFTNITSMAMLKQDRVGDGKTLIKCKRETCRK